MVVRRLGLATVVLMIVVPFGPAPTAAAVAEDPPGAPTDVTAAAREGGALVSWRPPEDPGMIIEYAVTASPGGLSMVVDGSVTEVVAGNLTSGTAYTFTVMATNDAGSGPVSEPSAEVTPTEATAPAAPTGVTAIARHEAAIVSWIKPPTDGGRAIASYTVTATPGEATATVTAPATEARLAALTNGTAYTFTVVARNGIGEGQPSGTSAPVMPQLTVPDTPTDVTAASAGAGSVRVSWRHPVDTGGLPLTGYTVIATPGERTVVAAGDATGIDVTGLSDGTEYTFTVTAANAAGAGLPSPATRPVTPDATRRDNAKILSAAALAALTSYSADGTLVFTDPPAEVTAFQAGDIIVANPTAVAPEGLLRTVAMVVTEADTVTVTTAGAALADALTSGAISIDDRLTPEDGATFVPAESGIRLRPNDVTIGNKFVLELSTDLVPGKLSAAGTLSIEPIVHFSVNLDDGVRAKVSFETRKEVALSLKSQHQVQLFQPVKKRLGTWNLGTRVIPVAGWPLIVRFQFDIYLTATGSVSIGTEASVSSAYTTGGGVEYRDGGFHPVKAEPNPQTEIKPLVASAATNLQAGPRAELTAYIYGALGPAITLDAALKLTFNLYADPWAKVEIVIKLGVAFKLNLIKQEIEASMTLFEKSWLLWQSEGAYVGLRLGILYNVAPNQTRFLGAHYSWPDRPYTWSLPENSAGTLTNYFYTAPDAAGEYPVKAQVPASGLLPPASGYVMFRVDPSLPAVPSPPASITITRIEPFYPPNSYDVWMVFTPSASPGAAPVVRYEVFPDPQLGSWHVFNPDMAGTEVRFELFTTGPRTFTFSVVACQGAGGQGCGPPTKSEPITV